MRYLIKKILYTRLAIVKAQFSRVEFLKWVFVHKLIMCNNVEVSHLLQTDKFITVAVIVINCCRDVSLCADVNVLVTCVMYQWAQLQTGNNTSTRDLRKTLQCVNSIVFTAQFFPNSTNDDYLVYYLIVVSLFKWIRFL